MSNKNLLPPWRDVRPDGTLGPERGPKTVATYVRQNTRQRDWSFRPAHKVDGAELVHEFMRKGPRETVPTSESDAYQDVFCDGYSVRGAARLRGLSRETVRSYVKRLRERAGKWLEELRVTTDTSGQ